MGVAAASAVERLAACVADRVDGAVFAEHLQVPVDGRQADLLALVLSSAWICWALENPGIRSSATASASACRVPRTRVPRPGVARAG